MNLDSKLTLNKIVQTVTKTTTRKKNTVKKFHNFLAGLFNINFDSSTNYEGSEYDALMRRRDELRAEKLRFGYSEKNQRELDDVNRKLQEYVR